MNTALITLHHLPQPVLAEQFTTVTFLKSDNGFNGIEMANVFYRFFDEANVQSETIENMIRPNKSEITLYSFTPYSVEHSKADYHYHLDLETMGLVVNEKDLETGSVSVCFDGRIDTFINGHLGCVRCALLSNNPKKVITMNVLMRELDEIVKKLKNRERLTDELMTSYCNVAESICVTISSLSLTPREKSTLEPIMQLVSMYKALCENIVTSHEQ